jgi:hypothetical protein
MSGPRVSRRDEGPLFEQQSDNSDLAGRIAAYELAARLQLSVYNNGIQRRLIPSRPPQNLNSQRALPECGHPGAQA